MRKAIFTMIIALTLLLVGCQLAEKTDAAPETPTDTLCGFFVTLEPIGNSTELTALSSDNETIQETTMSAAEPRIYAEYYENKGSNSYSFGDVKGYYSLCLSEPIEGGGYSMKPVCDTGIEFIGVNQTLLDCVFTGKIQFDTRSRCEFYANPIYQSPDGRVYCTPGSGYYNDADDRQPGHWGCISKSWSEVINTDGQKKTHTIKSVLNVEGINTVTHVVVNQMNSDDEMITQAVITKDNIPASIKVQPETSYIVTEEYSEDSAGKETIARTVLQQEDTNILVRFSGEHGIATCFIVNLVIDDIK